MYDKKIAYDFWDKESFIDVYPEHAEIYAINSKRQLFHCSSNFRSGSEIIKFKQVNKMYNVMKCAINNGTIIAMKLVKQLDQMMMIKRDPNDELMLSDICLDIIAKSIVSFFH